MPVTPYCNQLFQTHKDLYQFLSSCKHVSCEKDRSQIISISLEIDPVDPLVVLNEIADSNQLNFYFEKQDLAAGDSISSQHSAIAAISSAIHFQATGRDRFQQVKAFIESTLATTVMAGDVHLPFSGPHFFCSFSFAENPTGQVWNGFPSATVFLPSWQVSYYDNRCLVVANLAIDSETDLEQTASHVWHRLQTIRSAQYELLNPAVHHQELLKERDVTTTEHFKQGVRTALKSIQTNIFSKIVLAHAIDVVSPLPFDPVYSLNNLRQLYPDCYIFSTSNGKGQHFIGASPERLVCLRKQQLVTDALAGSAPRGQTTYEDAQLANALLNSTKEMHEHQVVIDFITRRLAQLGLMPQRSPLRLLQLSNIQHLHTPIWASVPAQIHLLDILAELHPTPAVAGMPREQTWEQIRRYEPFERSLYAAPIGWISHTGDGEFAVGIRSALIDGCRARLFAGAGIVAGSDPDRELAEVQLKLQALLAALV